MNSRHRSFKYRSSYINELQQFFLYAFHELASNWIFFPRIDDPKCVSMLKFWLSRCLHLKKKVILEDILTDGQIYWPRLLHTMKVNEIFWKCSKKKYFYEIVKPGEGKFQFNILQRFISVHHFWTYQISKYVWAKMYDLLTYLCYTN